MRNITSGQVIPCRGQEVLFVVDHTSDVTIEIKNSAGNWIPVEVISATGGLLMPGYAGAEYRAIFSAGTVDIFGA